MKLTAGSDCAGKRLDAYLAEKTDLSRTAAARLCESGAVLLDGRAAEKRAPVTPGGVIEWEEPAPAPAAAEAEEIPLDIV